MDSANAIYSRFFLLTWLESKFNFKKNWTYTILTFTFFWKKKDGPDHHGHSETHVPSGNDGHQSEPHGNEENYGEHDAHASSTYGINNVQHAYNSPTEHQDAYNSPTEHQPAYNSPTEHQHAYNSPAEHQIQYVQVEPTHVTY